MRLRTSIYPALLCFLALAAGWGQSRPVATTSAADIPHRVYEAELRFDGTRYHWRPDDPFNPPLVGKVAGEVVISGSDAGTLLYP